MITIGKKWDKGAIYIGRGSPLGNPFVMQSEEDRDFVCDKYQEWFDAQINRKNEVVLKELRRIYNIAKHQDVILGCYCYPKRCHGETIKRFLDKYLDKEKHAT